MPGYPDGAAHRGAGGDRAAGRGDGQSGHPRAHPLGQRPGVHGKSATGVAAEDRGEDPLHRAGKPLGERLLRELQRHAQGRAAERRDLLQPEGGKDRDRALAKGI